MNDNVKQLIGVSKTTHATHYAQHIVVGSVDTDLGSVVTPNGIGGENKLKGRVVDSGEITGSRWLVLLRTQGKRVDVDPGVWGACVVLVWLNKVEVGSLTLREAVLAVKLELARDNWVLSPAVHVKRGLSKDEGTGVRDTRVADWADWEWHIGSWHRAVLGSVEDLTPLVASVKAIGTWVLEQTRGINEGDVVVEDTARNLVVAGEGCDTVWEGINGISVVKWLSTESAVQGRAKKERGTVVHVLVWLNDEDKLLTRVIEVKLDLVTGRSDRFVTSELKLLNQVLMWVLGHAATLISIKEDVIDVERSSNQRFLVGSGILH